LHKSASGQIIEEKRANLRLAGFNSPNDIFLGYFASKELRYSQHEQTTIATDYRPVQVKDLLLLDDSTRMLNDQLINFYLT
jgi:hypothetical protein